MGFLQTRHAVCMRIQRAMVIASLETLQEVEEVLKQAAPPPKRITNPEGRKAPMTQTCRVCGAARPLSSTPVPFGTDDPDTPFVFDTRELFGTDDPDTIERELFGSEDPDDRAELDELSLFDDEDGELDGHALLGDECAVADGLFGGQVSGEHLHVMPVGVGEGGASARRLVFDARVKEEDPGLWPCVG